MQIATLSAVLGLCCAFGAAAQNGPVGDLNADGRVDYRDLRILSGQWLSDHCEVAGCEADLNAAGGVDLADFAWLAYHWRADGRTPVINEFMASNGSRAPLEAGELLDADGDSSDWIELYNPTDRLFGLSGWYLTDDADEPAKWRFPDGVVLAPGQFLVVFASGKDRRAGELHTNFSLSAGGEYLALVMGDGVTVAHEYGPLYPEQLSDIAYGLGAYAGQFITSGSVASYHVPGPEEAGRDWTAVDFDDESWDTAQGSFGFSPTSQLVGYDIGAPAAPGGYVAQGTNAYMVHGDGTDIVGRQDSFYYLAMPLRGDGELTVRVLGMTNTDEWAKAGVMIRETLAPNARNAAQVVTPGHGTVFQRRTATGGSSTLAYGNGLAASVWLRIARRGNTVTGSYSPDGASWTEQGNEVIDMAQDAYIGFCVTSHAAGTPCAAVFDNVAFGSETDNLLKETMLGTGASLWTRYPFDAEEPDFFDRLELQIRYEDGFVAFLNGVEVARDNLTGPAQWDSMADGDRPDVLMGRPAIIDLSPHRGLLRDGRNVLAVQGLNNDASDEMFLLSLELEGSGDVAVPQYLVTPTPGSANITGAVGVTARPQFDPARGFCDGPFALTLTCETSGVTIRYTTDGTAPTATSGRVYAGPISVFTTTCVRAIAVKPGWMPSQVKTHTFIFPDLVSHQTNDPPGFPMMWGSTGADYEMDPDVVNVAAYRNRMRESLLSIPTLSLVTSLDSLFGSDGIYTNPDRQGVAWERPASIEWINPDGSTGFQVDAGLRVYGGAFRGMNLTRKKSFRLLFKREYGPTKLKFRMFDADTAASEFDTIILRGGANDAWNDWGRGNTQYIIDEFMRRLQLDLGRPSPHGTFVHLYLNGLYWGLYNAVERPESSFAATYFGGDKEQWDAVNSGSAVGESSTSTWQTMLSLSRQGGATHDGYQRLQGNDPDGTPNPDHVDYLDVENYIDYLFSNFWGGTGDWPHHNFYAACRRPPNATGFKFFNWDSEGAIVVWSSLTADRTNVTDGAGQPYAVLRTNKEFQLLFADHAHRHLFNDGPATSTASYARYKELADQVESAVIAESARWGDQAGGNYTLADWQTRRDYVLNTYMPQRSGIVLGQLRSAGLYPQVDAPICGINGVPQQGGRTPANAVLTMAAPAGGNIYYTLDGTDPRMPGWMSGADTIVTLLPEDAPKRVLVPSQANGGDQLGNTSAQFEVTYYKANITVSSLAAAESVIANPLNRAQVVRATTPVINFFNTGGRGNFEDDLPFPGTTIGGDVEDFVILATAKVLIPEAGDWTFGVNSDDGFALTLTNGRNTYQSSYPNPRSPGDTLSVFPIATAGQYDLRLVFYERGGGSELELFAARGNVPGFVATRFHLVGDIGSGGLQVGDGDVWFTPFFDDSSWTAGTGGVGYEAGTGRYPDYFDIDVLDEMYHINGSCYIRVPFTVQNPEFSNLILKVRYDDGFVAYINGAEVARRNLSGEPAWNSTASGSNADDAAIVLASIDISKHVGVLREGTNLLAVHGLNLSVSSSDFLISVELVGGEISQGAVSPTALTYAGPVTLAESTLLKARTFDGTWSALNEAVFAVGPVAESLRISELMYHPGDPNTEYVELTNIGSETINLNRVAFTNGIDFTFGSFELAPGAYCLLVQDPVAFEARYGAGFNIAGRYAGSLNNAGECIELHDAAGQPIHNFRFEDGWYDITDGLGFSLTVTDPIATEPNGLSDKRAWRPSAYAGGSPGFDDSGDVVELGAVVINELLANSQGGTSDWIELHNTTDRTIHLGGWFLSDDADALTKYEIADGTSLPAGGYLVFYENLHFGNENDPGCRAPFALSRDGEAVYLHSGFDAVLGGYSEEERFGASDPGVTLGRYRKSTGTYNFVALWEPTPGRANAGPQVGPIVISEIMYHPNEPAEAEYVELLNISPSAVTFHDPQWQAPWRLTDDPDDPGIEFLFPTDPPVVLAPGQCLVIAKDATVFADRYTTPTDARVLVWGPGSLANGTDRVQLSKPGGADADRGGRWIRVDRVVYSDGSHPEDFAGGVDPWPPGADGQGLSLHRIEPSDYGNDPANWRAGPPSPGSVDF